MKPATRKDLGVVTQVWLYLACLLVVDGNWRLAGWEATGDSAALAGASTVAAAAWEGSSIFIDLYDPTVPELAVQALSLPCGVDFEVAGEGPEFESEGKG